MTQQYQAFTELVEDRFFPIVGHVMDFFGLGFDRGTDANSNTTTATTTTAAAATIDGRVGQGTGSNTAETRTMRHDQITRQQQQQQQQHTTMTFKPAATRTTSTTSLPHNNNSDIERGRRGSCIVHPPPDNRLFTPMNAGVQTNYFMTSRRTSNTSTNNNYEEEEQNGESFRKDGLRKRQGLMNGLVSHHDEIGNRNTGNTNRPDYTGNTNITHYTGNNSSCLNRNDNVNGNWLPDKNYSNRSQMSTISNSVPVSTSNHFSALSTVQPLTNNSISGQTSGRLPNPSNKNDNKNKDRLNDYSNPDNKNSHTSDSDCRKILTMDQRNHTSIISNDNLKNSLSNHSDTSYPSNRGNGEKFSHPPTDKSYVKTSTANVTSSFPAAHAQSNGWLRAKSQISPEVGVRDVPSCPPAGSDHTPKRPPSSSFLGGWPAAIGRLRNEFIKSTSALADDNDHVTASTFGGDVMTRSAELRTNQDDARRCSGSSGRGQQGLTPVDDLNISRNMSPVSLSSSGSSGSSGGCHLEIDEKRMCPGSRGLGESASAVNTPTRSPSSWLAVLGRGAGSVAPIAAPTSRPIAPIGRGGSQSAAPGTGRRGNGSEQMRGLVSPTGLANQNRGLVGPGAVLVNQKRGAVSPEGLANQNRVTVSPSAGPSNQKAETPNLKMSLRDIPSAWIQLKSVVSRRTGSTSTSQPDVSGYAVNNSASIDIDGTTTIATASGTGGGGTIGASGGGTNGGWSLVQHPLGGGGEITQSDDPIDSTNPAERLGRIQFSIAYDFPEMTLTLRIIRAVDLAAKDFSGTSDPYVKIMLLPDKKRKLTTNVKRKNLNPRWNEVFAFEGFPYNKLMHRTLYMQVLDYDRFSRDDPIGEVCIPLSDFDLTAGQVLWKNLQPCKGHTGKLGELNIGLCYQPATGRITVVINKARELKAKDINGLSDPYVKIWVMHDGKKSEKKKTVIKEKTLNPVFNESFDFDVPYEKIRATSISISVMDYDRMGRNEEIGQVILGTKSGPMEVKHWNEMFAKTRQVVTQWHVLKDFS